MPAVDPVEEPTLPLTPEQETLRLRARVHKLADTVQDHVGDLIRIDERIHALDVLIKQGPDVENIQFNTRTVVWLVVFLAAMIGGMYASTYGIRSDIRDILTHASLQGEVDKQKALTEVERAKLIDDRMIALRTQLDDQKREQALWKYDMQRQMQEIIASISERKRIP